MTIIEAIADLIDAAAIPGLTGSTNRVFVYSMPSDTDYGVLVIPVPESFVIREYTPGYLSGEFMVVIRHESIEESIDMATLIAAAIDVSNSQSAAYDIKRCRPTNLPFPFPRSEGDNYEALVQGVIHFAEK